jgi:segregation and condensation protein B
MSKRKKPAPTSQADGASEDAATQETTLEPAEEDTSDGEGDATAVSARADVAGGDKANVDDPLETTDVSPPVTHIEEVATAAANAEPTEETLALGAELDAALGADEEPTQETTAATTAAGASGAVGPHEEITAKGVYLDPLAGGADASAEAVAGALDDLSDHASYDSSSDDASDGWEEPTRVAEANELAELQAQSAEEPVVEVESQTRLESIIESLLFAAERPLNLADLKRLVNERDAKKLIAALGALQARHQVMGIQLASAAGGWQFRTNPENATWVAKMVAGRPARLSRAMLETLAIVAYRQPITRPEIDEIRGVDCGPVLKTLLDRTLIRMIGKKEEVGRPILYGTTPEFLRTFSLKDLSELPTLRQFHELGVAEQAKVDAETPATAKGAGGEHAADAGAPRAMPKATNLPEHDPDEEEALLAELDDATASATRATRSPDPVPPVPPEASEAGD